MSYVIVKLLGTWEKKYGKEIYKYRRKDLSAGRPRATLKQVQLHGLDRDGRYKSYGNSDGLLIPKDTILNPPYGLSERTKKAWETIVPNLIQLQVLNEQDLPTLETMFNSYEEYVKALKAIKKFDKQFDPLDMNQVKHRRALNQWLMDSINSFNRIAARFGITPCERTRLNLQMEEKIDDPLSVVLGE